MTCTAEPEGSCACLAPVLAALSCVWQASGAGHQGTRRSVHAPRDIRHDGRFRLILRGVAFLSASAVPPLQRPPLAAAIHDHQPLLSTLAAPLLFAAAAAPRPSESTRSAVVAAARPSIWRILSAQDTTHAGAFVSRVEDGGYQLFRTAGRPGVGCPRAGTRSPSDASAGQRASGERRDGRCR